MARHDFGKMTGPGRRFHKIAVDLDRAWAASRLTRYERRILQYVREHGWGCSSASSVATPISLNLSRLSRIWGMPRPKLSEAVSALSASRMLIADGGLYSIGKDAHAWPKDRISAEDLRYAVLGDRPQTGTPPVPERGHPLSLNGDRHRPQTGTPPVPVQGQAPIDEAPASEDFRKINTEQTREGEGGNPVPDPGQGVDPWKDPSRPEVDRLVDWLAFKLAKEDHDEDTIAKVSAEARKWCEAGRTAVHFAQAIQAGIDNLALSPASYIRPILKKIRDAQDAGLAVEAPADCGFIPDARLRLGESAKLPAYVDYPYDAKAVAYWAARRDPSKRAPRKSRAEIMAGLRTWLLPAPPPSPSAAAEAGTR